ncbi:hypothetical protein P692DRAFT_20876137 [Suillus brevipes Sb2]|nr:hypothetical protein P692DRAFT_20876137 [Suillus brevipes Sb2]
MQPHEDPSVCFDLIEAHIRILLVKRTRLARIGASFPSFTLRPSPFARRSPIFSHSPQQSYKSSPISLIMTSSNLASTSASSSVIPPATAIGNSSTTSITNPISTATPSGMQMSYDQIILENTRRLTNNIALQARRDANELNVPADDLLIPVPPKPVGTAI